MKGLLGANMRAHMSRYVATTIAIALAVAFIIVCLSISGGFRLTMERAVASETLGATMVVTRSDDASPHDTTVTLREVANRLRDDSAVDAVEPRFQAFTMFELVTPHAEFFGKISPMPDAPFTRPTLTEGRYPTANGEIVVSSKFATLGIKVGSTVVNSSADSEATFTVTGLIESSSLGGNETFITAADYDRLYPDSEPSMLVVSSTKNIDDVQNAVDMATGDAGVAVVSTQHDYVAKTVDAMAGATGMITAIILVFPGLAAITAIIVISTTFQVQLLQRQRELALLRSIGADGWQVRRLVLAETGLVGLVGAVIGVLIGVPSAIVVLRAAKLVVTTSEALRSFTVAAVVTSMLCGVAIAIIAGWGPAKRAAKLSPMVALQPEDASAVVRRRAWVRLILGSILTVGAGGTLAYLTTRQTTPELFILAFLCGLLSFVGVIMLCTLILPPIIGTVGRLIGTKRVVASLAAENAMRNPRRTGATATALILGLSLVVTMMVGSATLSRTFTDELNSKRPIDLVVTTSAPMDAQAKTAARKIAHVTNTVILDGVTGSASTVPGEEVTIYRADELSAVAREAQPTPGDDEVAVSGELWDPDATRVDITVGDSTVSLKPVLSRTPSFTVSPVVFAKLTAHVPAGQLGARAVLAKLDDSVSTVDITTVQSQAAALSDSVTSVEAPAMQRVMMLGVIQSLNWGIIGMLAVSIIVALVGVANTLSLSVVERRRENALLRSIGMTRAGIRRMLAVEALLLVACAVTIGVLLGIAYGLAGARALPWEGEISVTLTIPWLQIAAAVVIALVAAMLASIVPSISASRVVPVEALARDD